MQLYGPCQNPAPNIYSSRDEILIPAPYCNNNSRKSLLFIFIELFDPDEPLISLTGPSIPIQSELCLLSHTVSCPQQAQAMVRPTLQDPLVRVHICLPDFSLT